MSNNGDKDSVGVNKGSSIGSEDEEGQNDSGLIESQKKTSEIGLLGRCKENMTLSKSKK